MIQFLFLKQESEYFPVSHLELVFVLAGEMEISVHL